MVCKNYLEINNGLGYCGIKDMKCLNKKYNKISKYIVHIPYKKEIIIYGCDGKLEKEVKK